jgi:hypothetical protein
VRAYLKNKIQKLKGLGCVSWSRVLA